jgi:hypothetical protein
MNKNEFSFSERMAAGKERAANDRYKGKSTGKAAAGWTHKRSDRAPFGLDDLEAYYNQFRKDIHYNAFAAVEYALFGHEWEGIEL